MSPAAGQYVPGKEDGMDEIKEYGMDLIREHGKTIRLVTIIGEIEGHEVAGNGIKTTKYEHLLPMLVEWELDPGIDGVLFLINTVGGDVSCGLALAEMIASMKKPTVALVVGDSHSIGVALSVAAQRTVIAPTATVILHPVRLGGQVLGAPQTFDYLKVIQDRITGFLSLHTGVEEGKLEEMMLRPGILNKDLGTILVGRQAVECGLFDQVGGILEAMEAMRELLHLSE